MGYILFFLIGVLIGVIVGVERIAGCFGRYFMYGLHYTSRLARMRVYEIIRDYKHINSKHYQKKDRDYHYE